MLSININRDVEQYQETVFMGLNAGQTISALVTLLGGVGMICLCHYVAGISLQISIYLTTPFCIALFLPSLKTKEGLSMAELIRKSGRGKKKLLYKTTDVSRYRVVPQEKEIRKGKRNEYRQNKKKIQISSHQK